MTLRAALVLVLLACTAACSPRQEVRRTFYADGRPWTELGLRDGKPDGPFTTWHTNGQKANEGSHIAGRLHGKVTEWGEDGTVVLEASYDRGHLDGPWRERWPDGKDRCTAEYHRLAESWRRLLRPYRRTD